MITLLRNKLIHDVRVNNENSKDWKKKAET
jgi:hypothetical protein